MVNALQRTIQAEISINNVSEGNSVEDSAFTLNITGGDVQNEELAYVTLLGLETVTENFTLGVHNTGGGSGNVDVQLEMLLDYPGIEPITIDSLYLLNTNLGSDSNTTVDTPSYGTQIQQYQEGLGDVSMGINASQDYAGVGFDAAYDGVWVEFEMSLVGRVP